MKTIGQTQDGERIVTLTRAEFDCLVRLSGEFTGMKHSDVITSERDLEGVFAAFEKYMEAGYLINEIKVIAEQFDALKRETNHEA